MSTKKKPRQKHKLAAPLASSATNNVPAKSATDPKAIVIERRDILPGLPLPEAQPEVFADLAVEGVFAAASTTIRFSRGALNRYEIDFARACVALDAQIAATKKGGMGIADTLLVSQAVTLNAIFHECSRLAALNMTDFPEAMDRYMRLGLKAQSQCRATLESLAAIKNPPVFAKQANIARGHQQVNNKVTIPLGSRGETEIVPNKLLEHGDGEPLDAGTKSTAGGSNPPLEAVATQHGPSHGKRQSGRKS